MIRLFRSSMYRALKSKIFFACLIVNAAVAQNALDRAFGDSQRVAFFALFMFLDKFGNTRMDG